MEVHLSVVIVTIINFVILFFVLKHLLFAKVTDAMDKRQENIVNNIEKAKKDVGEARNLKAQSEELLKEARQEGKKLAEENKKRAEKLYADIVEEAHKEAAMVMERGRIEIEREKEKAKDELKTQVVELSLLFSSKALEETIDEAKHKQLINDFISKVGI